VMGVYFPMVVLKIVVVLLYRRKCQMLITCQEPSVGTSDGSNVSVEIRRRKKPSLDTK
jgi:hypothetical protein